MTYPELDAVEIWNEPGQGPAGSMWHSRLNRYARMAIMTYSQLKAQFPAVTFVGPTTVNAERGDWLGEHWQQPINHENSIFNCTDMQAYRDQNGGRLPFDVISFHAYGGRPDGDFYFGRNFHQYFDEIVGYRDRNGRPIIGTLPIWFTEYGWKSTWSSLDDHLEDQRVWQERMIGMILQRPQIRVPFWYNYRDDEPPHKDPGSENNTYGLRRNSDGGFAPKRVYYAFMAHSNLVGLYTPDGFAEWPIDEIINKYKAAGGRRTVGHPWNDGGPWYGDKAHSWGPSSNPGIVQNFRGGELGEAAITVQPGRTEAFLIRGGFWQHYRHNGGPYVFGWPLTDEYFDGAYVVQHFQAGSLRWRSGEAVTWSPLRLAAFDHVNALDETNGRLKHVSLLDDGRTLFVRFLENGVWSPWKVQSVQAVTGLERIRSISLAPRPDGTTKQDILSWDGTTLYYRLFVNGAWQPMTSVSVSALRLPAGVTSLRSWEQTGGDAELGPSRLKQTAISADGATLYYRLFEGSVWGPWHAIQVSQLGIPNVTSLQSFSQGITPGGVTKQDVISMDGTVLYQRTYQNNVWGPWQATPVSWMFGVR
jgi:hypothetical protein